MTFHISYPHFALSVEGCDVSNFSLISDFFTSTPLQIVFEIASLERVSHDFITDSHFQKKIYVLVQTFH